MAGLWGEQRPPASPGTWRFPCRGAGWGLWGRTLERTLTSEGTLPGSWDFLPVHLGNLGRF